MCNGLNNLKSFKQIWMKFVAYPLCDTRMDWLTFADDLDLGQFSNTGITENLPDAFSWNILCTFVLYQGTNIRFEYRFRSGYGSRFWIYLFTSWKKFNISPKGSTGIILWRSRKFCGNFCLLRCFSLDQTTDRLAVIPRMMATQWTDDCHGIFPKIPNVHLLNIVLVLSYWHERFVALLKAYMYDSHESVWSPDQFTFWLVYMYYSPVLYRLSNFFGPSTLPGFKIWPNVISNWPELESLFRNLSN